MSGATCTVIAPWGSKKFLVLTDAGREMLRFHLDSAKRFPFGSARRELHMGIARHVAGMIAEDRPARTKHKRTRR